MDRFLLSGNVETLIAPFPGNGDPEYEAFSQLTITLLGQEYEQAGEYTNLVLCVINAIKKLFPRSARLS